MTDLYAEIDELLPRARWLVGQPEILDKDVKSFSPGWVGFGGTKPQDRVLVATDSHHDIAITQAIAIALREVGASVDVITLDAGPDRKTEEDDEIKAMIRRGVWHHNLDYVPRRYNDVPWITELLQRHGYDLYIQGRAYPNSIPCRWEGHPWTQKEQFLSEANIFPRDLHILINRKGWEPIFENGRGSRVHISDPEGTEFSYTLFPEYWEPEVKWFDETPYYAHLMYHPAPPIIAKEDATGVVAGTLAHFSRPFPLIQVHVENGRVEEVEGGGGYGDGWRDLMRETQHVQYRQFPRTGMFWFWEAALGTNPKVKRPSEVLTVSSGGTEWERWRAGLMHLGFGTAGPSEDEEWAAQQDLPYGHLHVHLQFPTIEIESPDGTRQRTVDRGHLLALDDPEVRQAAEAYGNPDEVLHELWVPPIPGISIPGDFEVFARDPARWFGREA